MEGTISLRELTAHLQTLTEGLEDDEDLPIYTGDMEPMTLEDFKLIERDAVEKRSNYLHIGRW